jgi:hypothetical protein
MLVFGGLFITSFVAPTSVERAADDLVIHRVQRELRQQFGPEAVPSRDALLTLLGSMPERAREVGVVRSDLLREHLTANQGNPDALEAGRRAYERLRAELIRELRIFAGSNFVLFAFTAWLTVVRRADTRNLVAPAALLATVTLLSAILFLVGQDWAWTFLTGDYAGYGYFVVVAAVSGLLIDIAWYRARVASIIARALWWWPV